jgi:hypothetical protein
VNDERRLNLRESLHLADSLLTANSMSSMLNSTDNDSLRLNLPPLVGNGSTALTPDANTLKVMATLYFQAELEQTGIIAVAELLADSRNELKNYGNRSAKLIEDYYRQKRDGYDRTGREHIYARVYGIGVFAKTEAGGSVNNDFQSKFANFCLSLGRYADNLNYQRSPNPIFDSAFRQSAADLLVNLGARRYGDIHEAAKRIQNQLSKSIAVLEDEGIGNLFQTKGMWNVLRIVLHPNVPDFARLTTRGQSGLRLLNRLSSMLRQIDEKDYRKPVSDITSEVVNWAEMWLEASGFDVRQMYLRRTA